jgi:hypothetical protein
MFRLVRLNINIIAKNADKCYGIYRIRSLEMVKIINEKDSPVEIREAISSRKVPEFTPSLDEKTLTILSKNFFYYMKKFGFKKSEQAIWLGMGTLNYTTLKKYRDTETLRADWDIYNRVAELFGIIKSLGVLYPRNEEIVHNWVNVKRDIFNGKSAREFICEEPHESYMRIRSVRRILDMYRNGVINDIS